MVLMYNSEPQMQEQKQPQLMMECDYSFQDIARHVTHVRQTLLHTFYESVLKMEKKATENHRSFESICIFVNQKSLEDQ